MGIKWNMLGYLYLASDDSQRGRMLNSLLSSGPSASRKPHSMACPAEVSVLVVLYLENHSTSHRFGREGDNGLSPLPIKMQKASLSSYRHRSVATLKSSSSALE